MAASAWMCRTEWEPDVARALQRVRRRVLEAGCGAGGSGDAHPILDVLAVAARPGARVVAPMATDRLLELVGTDRPSVDAIEELAPVIWHGVPRGQGRYLVAYEGERPTHLVFLGVSSG